MDTFLVYIILLSSVLFLLSLYVVFSLKSMKRQVLTFQTQIESYEFIINEVRADLTTDIENHREKEQSLNLWKTEHQQISQQLEHRIKVLQERANNMDDQIQNILQEVPENKLYQRAQKMVQLGADIDEIIRECELPQAEAEILLSMYKKQ